MRTSMSTDLGWEEAVHATLQEGLNRIR